MHKFFIYLSVSLCLSVLAGEWMPFKLIKVWLDLQMYMSVINSVFVCHLYDAMDAENASEF